jgi:spore germination protein GerM
VKLASVRPLMVLVATAIITTACGLPARKVTRLDPTTVPFGLLQTSPPSASPQVQGPQAVVYFFANGWLATARRTFVGDNVAAEAARALMAGPTAAESARGFSTDLPPQTRVISLDVTGSVATVDMSGEFGDVGGSEQVFAVAQLVYTLTAPGNGISAVRFAISGSPIEVPDASGSLSAAPRTRSDYRSLAPAMS